VRRAAVANDRLYMAYIPYRDYFPIAPRPSTSAMASESVTFQSHVKWIPLRETYFAKSDVFLTHRLL
jgi:hypothetical protein